MIIVKLAVYQMLLLLNCIDNIFSGTGNMLPMIHVQSLPCFNPFMEQSTDIISCNNLGTFKEHLNSMLNLLVSQFPS